LIAALCFLESFASGQGDCGFAWCNPNAALGDCTAEGVTFVDNAVEEMFYDLLSFPLDDWVPLDSGLERNLR
jgi:hypothetical protein